ncbi:MAG: protein TolR [Desulfuromonadales bacterium]|jgi:biopolymer transport protein TolR|nr:protein TolR [Desulfuromonadales bacterium]
MEVGQRESRRRSALAQINVTPFVDVMLVLLIIFMVTAPMLEKGVDVALPEVENAPNLAAAKQPLIVTVTRKGDLMVGKNPVESTEKLIPVLQQILASREDKTVYLEADRKVPYGRVVQVMAAMKKAGVAKLGMVAQEPTP